MAEKVSQLVQKGNFKRILKYLARREINLIDFKDNKGNSLLHLATLINNTGLLTSIKEHVSSN